MATLPTGTNLWDSPLLAVDPAARSGTNLWNSPTLAVDPAARQGTVASSAVVPLTGQQLAQTAATTFNPTQYKTLFPGTSTATGPKPMSYHEFYTLGPGADADPKALPRLYQTYLTQFSNNPSVVQGSQVEQFAQQYKNADPRMIEWMRRDSSAVPTMQEHPEWTLEQFEKYRQEQNKPGFMDNLIKMAAIPLAAYVGGGLFNSMMGGGGATAAGGAGATGYTPLPSSGMVGTGGISAGEGTLMGVGSGGAGTAAGAAAGATGAGSGLGGLGSIFTGGGTSGGGLLGNLGSILGGGGGSGQGLLGTLGGLLGGGGGNLAGIAGSILSGIQGSNVGAAAQQGANMADPFAAQRPFYQEQLRKLMTDPSYITQTPMYQAAMNTGLESVNRSIASRGQLGSGARLTGLMNYGQEVASNLFMPYANLLSGLAMSGSSPAAAGQLYAQGKYGQQDYWGDMVKQGLVGLGGLGGIFNSGSSSGPAGNIFADTPSASYTPTNYSSFFGPTESLFPTMGDIFNGLF